MSRLSAHFKVTFPEFTLNADLEIPLQGFTAVFGPSGCGKTTLLRCLAGLERSPEGRLNVGSDVWQDEKVFLPVHQRPIGVVFQEARLFTHLSVEGNLRYGLKRRTGSTGESLFGQVIDIMGLESFLNRRPHQLSGGEKQRVAIGRALLTRPRLLLMDEPLAALDVQRKQEILPYLKRLQTELSLPVIYVTHSLSEVLQLVDTMVLLEQGQVTAVGPVDEVFTGLGLKGKLGPSMAGAILDTEVAQQDDEFKLTVLKFKDHTLYVPRQEAPIGSRLRVHIHAEDVALAVSPIENQTSALNVLPAKIVSASASTVQDHKAEVQLDIGSPLAVSITRKSLARLNLKPGQQVYAHIKTMRMMHDFD